MSSVPPTPDFERLVAAITRARLPDRVPLAEGGIDPAIMAAFLGRPVNDLPTFVEFWRRAGYDYAVLEVRGQPLADSAQVRIGGGVVRAHSQHSQTTGAAKGIHDRQSFESYPWIGIEGAYFGDVDRVAPCLPDGMKLIVNVGPIFSGIWRCMGMETFAECCVEQPELVAAIAQKMGGITVQIAANVVQRPYVGGIWLGDDLAYTGGLMVSPAFLRAHVFPHYRAIGALCRRSGRLFIHHSDGNKTAVFHDLIDCGVQAIHPNEPTSVDLQALKRQWGDRAAFIGNVDVALLINGPPPAIVDCVKELLRTVAPGGGFALGSGNTVTADVPLANYLAMINTVKRFGGIY